MSISERTAAAGLATVLLTYPRDASYLTDTQWAEVLRNCGVMYGWVIDRKKKEIIRAPRPGAIMTDLESSYPSTDEN
jgi:hypothetical protein